MRWRFLVFVALLLAVPAAGCSTGTLEVDQFDGGTSVIRPPRPKDMGRKNDRASGPADVGSQSADLPAKKGALCPYGKCGPNLICMAGICLRTCTVPDGNCNDKAKECAANETCIWASSFSGACMRAGSGHLGPCGTSNFCAGGTLCVKVGNASPKCLKLCKYGCPPGAPCWSTDDGCKICIQ